MTTCDPALCSRLRNCLTETHVTPTDAPHRREGEHRSPPAVLHPAPQRRGRRQRRQNNSATFHHPIIPNDRTVNLPRKAPRCGLENRPKKCPGAQPPPTAPARTCEDTLLGVRIADPAGIPRRPSAHPLCTPPRTEPRNGQDDSCWWVSLRLGSELV
jgi:hypothetical protein